MKAIDPSRSENYSEWFHAVIQAADLAEQSPVRGCIVIKPWGFAIWEKIQSILDKMIKDTGHSNAYFPLFIPLSFIEKESLHVDGFAKECAVVTHKKLVKNAEGKLVPDGELEEPLVVRPTSETIIGHMFAQWINSYRDLPVLINQWANVVRWEMRTRPFLRTSEFLWQEGHTAHATEEEAIAETVKMLGVYKDLVENYLAIKTIIGIKTKSETFPGAEVSYCLEGLMQDKKALQMGTSHYLGQNFSKSFGIKFNTKNKTLQHVYTTSWGVSTRLLGALIMCHSDDNGLVLPPRIAPMHVVIFATKKYENDSQVIQLCRQLHNTLSNTTAFDKPLRCILDTKDEDGGSKKWKWIKKGAPIILEVGHKELTTGNAYLLNRLDLSKVSTSIEDIASTIYKVLQSQQDQLLKNSSTFTSNSIIEVASKEEFYNVFKSDSGLALCYCCEGDHEDTIKQDLQVTPRCIPLSQNHPEGKCIFTNKPTKTKIIFGKAY